MRKVGSQAPSPAVSAPVPKGRQLEVRGVPIEAELGPVQYVSAQSPQAPTKSVGFLEFLRRFNLPVAGVLLATSGLVGCGDEGAEQQQKTSLGPDPGQSPNPIVSFHRPDPRPAPAPRESDAVYERRVQAHAMAVVLERDGPARAQAEDGSRASVSNSHEAWFSTDWFLAARAEGGHPGHNLWARGGPLDKVDQVTQGEARAFESQTPNWFQTDPKKRDGAWKGALQQGSVTEYNFTGAIGNSLTEAAFGVKDAALSPAIQGFDFMDGSGRNLLFGMKEGDRIGVVLRGRVLGHEVRTGEDGQPLIQLVKADGTELTSLEARHAHFAIVSQTVLGDGRLNQKVRADWWGNCDAATVAGLMFKKPERSVNIDGITFTPRDIEGLLTLVADEVDLPTEFVGNRYKKYKDIVYTKHGRVAGEIVSDLNRLKRGERDPRYQEDYRHFERWDGGDIRLRKPNGTEQIVPAERVTSVYAQLGHDMEPWTLVNTIMDWAKDGGGVADVDPYSPVFNRPFSKASNTEWTERPVWASTPAPREELVDPRLEKRWGELEVEFPDKTRTFRYFIAYDGEKPVTGGFYANGDRPPDFLWRPKSLEFEWPDQLERNPHVPIDLVRTLYEQSIAPD